MNIDLHLLTPEQLEQAFENSGIGICGEFGTGGIETVHDARPHPPQSSRCSTPHFIYEVDYGDDGSFNGGDEERCHQKVFVWWCPTKLRVMADT